VTFISFCVWAVAIMGVYYKNHFVIYIKTSARLTPHTRL